MKVRTLHITKLGLTLYLLSEQYVLNRDGRQVQVIAKERFGPISFLFKNRKTHTAEILDSGMRAVYYLPLLGAQWIAEYKVRADRMRIDSTMRCSWGEAHETIDRTESIARYG